MRTDQPFLWVFLSRVLTLATTLGTPCLFDTHHYRRLTSAVVISTHFASSGPRCKDLCRRQGSDCAAASIMYVEGSGLVCGLMRRVPNLLVDHLELDYTAMFYVKTDLDIASCEPDPCVNGATCAVGAPGIGAICLCVYGWTGPTCATVSDYCAVELQDPCNSCGVCVSGSSSYSCECPASGYDVTTSGCCDVTSFPGTKETVIVSSPTAEFPDVPVQVFEEHGKDGYDWIVLMRRHNGSQDFVNKDWDAYKTGFGDLSSEFWIGNENMYFLTNNGSNYVVRFDMRSFQKECRYAEYSTFSVAPESDGYRLTIAGHSGNAGEGMLSTLYSGGVTSGDQQFSTYDRGPSTSCAANYHGGWWHKACYYAKFTGLYGENPRSGEGIHWNAWLGYDVGLEYVDIKIRVN